MANEEAQSLDSNKSDPNSEKRKQIVEILVTWCHSVPMATVEILNFIQVSHILDTGGSFSEVP